MTVFFISYLSLLFLFVVSPIIYLQKQFSQKISNIAIEAFSNKLHKASRVYFKNIFKAIGVIIFFLSLALYVVQDDWVVVFGFVLGAIVSASSLYFIFFTINKLFAHIADKSSRGLIENFKFIFESGIITSLYLLNFYIFILVIYYFVFDVSVLGLVSYALGSAMVIMLFKLANYILVGDIDFKNKTANTPSYDRKDPRYIDILSRDNIFKSISVIADKLEIFIIILFISIVSASILLPGSTSALILPLVLSSITFFSSLLSIKLMKAGATTNIYKNILLAVFGSFGLSLILHFPAIVWAINDSVIYSNLNIWLSSLAGFLGGIFIIFLSYAVKERKIFGKRFLGIALIALVASGILFSHYLANFYGFAIFISTLASLFIFSMTLDIFIFSTENAEISAHLAELPMERKNIITKLSSIRRNLFNITRYHLIISSTFSLLGLFIVFQKEVSNKLIKINFPLSDIDVLAGLLIGIAFYFYIVNILDYYKPKKIKEKKNEDYFEIDNITLIKKFSLLFLLLVGMPYVVIFWGSIQLVGSILLGLVIFYIFDKYKKSDNISSADLVTGSIIRVLALQALILIIFLI